MMLKIITGFIFLMLLSSCSTCVYQPLVPATNNLLWENEAGMLQLCISGIARYELEEERVPDLIKASLVCQNRMIEMRENYRKDKNTI